MHVCMMYNCTINRDEEKKNFIYKNIFLDGKFFAKITNYQIIFVLFLYVIGLYSTFYAIWLNLERFFVLFLCDKIKCLGLKINATFLIIIILY